MKFVGEGMHATEYGKRLYSVRFNDAAVGGDGTGTLQLHMRDGTATSNVTGEGIAGRPAPTQHACTPAVSPNGKHVLVSVEMPTTAPGVPANVHANRHGGKGVYTDLYRMSPDGRNWTQLTQLAPVVNTPYFPDTPAGVLIPQWVSNTQIIYTEMVGYTQVHPLAIRRIVVADFVDRAGPPRLENSRRYTPGWAQGARFYEVWGVQDGVALVCTDYGRASQAFPGLCLWEIGSDELVPLSVSQPNDWEEQAFFVDGRIFFMSTQGLGYQPIGGNGANFWRTLQTEIRVMDMDGSHRERVTFIHDPNHADYVPRAADEAVRVLPFSKTPHGLYLDIVRNRGAVQLHGEAQVWHICL